MKIKITKTQKITIVLALFTVAGLVAFGLWYFSIVEKISLVKEDRNLYQQELRNSRIMPEIRNKLTLAKESELFFDSLYIKKDEALDFIELLEQKARLSDVDLNINSFMMDEQPENFSFVRVNLEIRGEFESINKFILTIENLPHYISVNDLKMNKDQGDNSWTASMSFKSLAK